MVLTREKIFTAKKNFYFIACLVIFISLIFFYKQTLRKAVFTKCVEHVDNSKTHTHTSLTIYQNQEKILIPKNIGITSDCMHPLHTHDGTGLIHMEYPKPMTFYLGDFFDVMGIIFKDNQLGALKTIDGYRISIKSDGKIVKSKFRQIPLKDLGKIEINVNSKN